MQSNEKINILIDAFDERMEQGSNLTDQEKEKFSCYVNSTDELSNGLVVLNNKAKSYKKSIEDCAANIKMWQESKKMWEGRHEALMGILENIMKKLSPPNNALKADGVKLSISTRTALEVDENWLLEQYQVFADSLQTQLPEYIVVKISIDKNKLMAHYKNGDKELMAHPDKVHTRLSNSTTIK